MLTMKNSKQDGRMNMKTKTAAECIDCEGMIRTLCECISIKSVKAPPEKGMPYGRGVYEALDYILKTAENMGFTTKNIDGHAGYVEYGEGEEMVAVLGHVDVVPAGNGWNTDPFTGIDDGVKITGRGALDDKGPVVAALYALKAIKESGKETQRRIRLIIGADEESGSSDMKRYRETEALPVYAFTPDAYFPVINSEKGMVVFKIEKKLRADDENRLVSASGGLAVNQVPDKAEMTVSIKGKTVSIRNSNGRSAHGSTPEMGINAIDDILKNASKSAGYGGYPKELREFTEFYLEYMYGDTRGVKLGADYSDEILGDVTFNTGILSGDESGISFLVDYRYPANTDCEPYLKKIEDICASKGMDFSVIKHKKGLYFPQNHELVKVLTDVYAEETGLRQKPKSMGGGTYAKSLPNTVAFGPLFPGREDTMHQANEYIIREDLFAAGRIYAEAMARLAEL